MEAYTQELNENRVPGIFGGDTYWWESGVLWNALIGYSYLTGDSQYDDRISQGILWQLGDYDAFMPPNQTKTLGNDDQSSWALAAMTAAEVGFPKPKDAEWADYASNIVVIGPEDRGGIDETLVGVCPILRTTSLYSSGQCYELRRMERHTRLYIKAAPSV